MAVHHLPCLTLTPCADLAWGFVTSRKGPPVAEETNAAEAPPERDPAVAEATKGKGTDKSVLVIEEMRRHGTPSYIAWAMTIPELIEKLETDGA